MSQGSLILYLVVLSGCSSSTTSTGVTTAEVVESEAPETGATSEAPVSTLPVRPIETQPLAPAGALDDSSSRHDLAAPLRMVEVDGVARASFGGEHQGFAQWVSANGRLVLLRRFLTDDDNSGGIEPRFGHHGMPHGDQPTLALFDLETGGSEVFDEIVGLDPVERYVVLRKEDLIWLVDSHNGGRLNLTAAGADPRSDRNPCLPARQASFDPLGRSVTWLREDPPGVVLRRLQDGEETEIEVSRSRGPLWRAEPAALHGWVVLYHVIADTDGNGSVEFPQQNTSCACRWCGRFAMSWGFYGWGGDEFRSALRSPNGELVEVDGMAIPLGGGIYGMARERTLHQSNGDLIPLPDGCDDMFLVRGSRAALLTCGDENRLFWPTDSRSVTLPVRVESAPRGAAVVIGSDGHPWLPVRANVGEAWRIGRLRMADGRLETGPEIGNIPTPPLTGWSVAQTGAGVVALSVSDGRLREAEIAETSGVRGLTLELGDGRWAVLGPEQGRWFETTVEPYLSTPTGCSVEAADAQMRLERGPWTLRCVAETSP